MNPINVLKREHEDIERELFELESIMEDEIINYSNLIHTFEKLCRLWDSHEREEEEIFAVMEKEQIRVPVYTMTCEHRDIRGHITRFKAAINSGSDFKIKDSLGKDIRVLVDKIREHMNQEDEILYTIALSEFSDEELKEMVRAIRKK